MRIDEIFEQALERRTPAERSAFLDGACAGDPELRRRAEELLVAHEEAGGFLSAPAREALAGSLADARRREGPGERIGPYRLLQEIGEGGMGLVYMAEQETPVRRKVALKIIKLGMDTKQVIARFEAERQALALMDHANIARVLDAGATEAGRPYFVMELVRGVPITEYCDANKLSTEERLRLFLAVCRAVHHAHQKGVIHRDIKPSNVLVTLHDGEPVPKIIDFGIAKATNQRLTEKTLFTEFKQFIGTPEYMSPEQAEMSGLDVDTRTDIYSLGVLLYQLLTGSTPIDAQTLRDAGWGELQRLIRDKETPSMSARVSRMGAAVATVARHRQVEPGALIRELRGDLDWIVMKALEKDRTRRYETAIDLAADLERHLADVPVEASPPSVAYKLRKFVRRNRGPVLAVTAVFAAVLLGLGLSLAGFVRASREAERNREVSAFLGDVLAATAQQGHSSDVDVAAVLADARRLFGEQHATVAAALSNLGLQLQNAGQLAEAEPLYRESLRLARELWGPTHQNVGITLARLGALLQARGEVEEAERAYRESLAIFEGLPGEPPTAGCEARLALAEMLNNRGEFEEASALLKAAIARYESRTPRPSFEILSALERLVMVEMGSGSSELEPSMRRLYEEVHAFYPPQSPFLAISAIGLANVLGSGEQPESAEPYLREALAIFRAQEDPPRVYYLTAVDRLFQILRRRPEAADETDRLIDEVLGLMRAAWGAQSPDLAMQLGALAAMRRERGRLAGAMELLAELAESLQQRPDPAARVPKVWSALVDVALELGADAKRTPEELGAGLSALRRLPSARRDELAGSFVLAEGLLLQRLGEPREALAALERARPPESLQRAHAAALALVERALGRAEQGKARIASTSEGEDEPQWVEALVAEALADPQAEQ